VLPLLIWLNTFVIIIAPINWLVEDLLNAEALHFSFILKDVVQDALSY
jgi:hypothetical protein